MAGTSQNQGGSRINRIEIPCFIQVADVIVEISNQRHESVFLWREADQPELDDEFKITLNGVDLSVQVNFDDAGDVKGLTFKKDGREMTIIDRDTGHVANEIGIALGVRKCTLVLESHAK